MNTQHDSHNKISTQLSLELSEVFYRTSKRFEKALLPLLALHFAALLIAVSLGLLFVALLSGLYFIFPQTLISILVLVLFGIILFGGLMTTYCAVPIMSVHIINKPSYGFEELFIKSLKQVPRVFTILALVGLAEMGGFILGVLPGIWLSVLLQFVFIILVLEHKNHKESIAQSVFLVKGSFWKVFGYVFALAIIGFLLATIPFFGFLFGLIYGFFVRTLVFELYKTLTHNRVTDATVKHTNKKIVNIVYILAAFSIFILVVITTILLAIVGLSTEYPDAQGGLESGFETTLERPL